MEEAAAAAVLRASIQNLIDFCKNEISQIQGVDEEAAKLAGTLEIMQKFLNHAESGTITGEDVKSWLKKLEDVAFDADNVLDEINYHILYKQIKPKKAKVLSFFNHIPRSRKMALKIKKMRENLDCINKDAAVLGLKERLAAAVPTLLDADASETDSYAVDPIFIGRDDVVSEIVEMLTNSITTDERRVSILPIVGMGGLGKSALTRKVFNHEMVKSRFESHIWVHVSPNFEPITLLKKILNNLTSHQVENASRQVVLTKLEEALKDKTYLLVLDDAWNEDLFKWDDFMNSFLGVGCVKGNAIVVTTRSMKAASIVNPLHVRKLKGLSAEDCWSIIKVKTFGEGNVPSEFETIGKKIATKCQGLPLAANVVGGTLTNQSEEKWRSIEEKWLSPYEGGDYMTKILRLSFDNLSQPSLKKCFAYCAMFPKGSRIIKQELIELWMAESFLQADGRDDMESVGEKFINVLLHNSLLQVSKRDGYGDVKSCGMHDLVHDLASSVSSSSNNTGGSSRVRYMTLGDDTSGDITNPIPKEMAKSLRTLFLGCDISGINFSDLESLHVLCLNYYGVKELSSSIGKLIHLRHFDISWTSIEYLPDRIGEFFHLQTLRVPYGYKGKLPSTIKYLINLRHLYINEKVELPAGIGRLTSLQTLTHFPVGDENGCKIEELGSLNNLKGELQIHNLERVRDKEEAGKANLFKKSKILNLCLEWDCKREGESNDENVLEGLQPHSDLKKLEIRGFNGSRFPLWTQKMAVGDVVLNKLMSLSLYDCGECEEIPMLGHLPNLKSLQLGRLINLKCINSSFYGMVNKDTRIVFPALERLTLWFMPKLTEWAEVEVSGGSEVKLFPRLQHLEIWWCEQLMSVPSHVSSCLQHLKIDGIGVECLPADWLFSNNQTLSELYIRECPNLRELWHRDSGGEQSQRSFTSLRRLRIEECKALEYLPCEMIGFSLEEISLEGQSSLKNLPKVFDSLPKSSRLKNLSIVGFPKFMANFYVETPHFPNLRDVKFGVSMSSMEAVDGILQEYCHSLNKLTLVGMESCECLPESIQLLTALSELELNNFGMEELPEWLGNLSSLQQLSLCYCKRLRRLPSMDAMHRLTTLKLLFIWRCSELVIKSEAADSEWPKLSHIPEIYINGDEYRYIAGVESGTKKQLCLGCL
ncbi:putative disease resistance protein RGA4 isoform X2 [Salvia miltiorrhiza]|uniref:putative disease resistance protein RGA4 isoform X2 n=1 Tax=Salvia miltiorrhiza TaxID=226208 RepID=UPI0025ACC2CD|nr:putative disease resistance protein RGA4 isoform X2 [Salvia miltiorrhiza]XP_057781736.1 putative disease resistance protein RGA4 isoform X2 [Salvia miltiorrhiza]